VLAFFIYGSIDMNKTESVFKTEVENIYKDLLAEQWGERIKIVMTSILDNTLSIQAESCLTPGEQNLIQDEKSWHLLNEMKTRAFEIIKPLLINSLEEKTNCRIKRVHSFIDKQGFRYELITFSQNIEELISEANQSD
jgi:uncharacterized protein YbcI